MSACRFCDLTNLSAKALKLHHDIMHPAQPYTCVCGSAFTSWNSFATHLKTCSIETPASATTCQDISEDNVASTSRTVFHDAAFDLGYGKRACLDAQQPIESSEQEQPIEASAPVMSDIVSRMKIKSEEFVAKLYNRPKLPRQLVQELIHDVDEFFCNAISDLHSAVLSAVDFSDSQSVCCNSVFSEFSGLFLPFSTEHRRFKHFSGSGDFIEPEPYKVGEIDIAVASKDGPYLKSKDVYGQSVPLDRVLKKFLELPDCLQEILEYMTQLNNSDSLENFIQGELWKRKRSQFPDEAVVLPLHMYYDDVECNNALGSRTLKLGAVYVSIPCLPPECQSSIENIFLALLFETWVRNFSDEIAFKPLVTMLEKLESEGITVTTVGVPKTVHFIPGLLLGDNLGLNSLCGNVECFTSNYFCRFCRIYKGDSEHQCVESPSLMRTVESYNKDVELDNPSMTGIKKDSVLNSLPSYHVAENFSVDVFHDCCEGVCHYTMLHVLKYCIPRYFTLVELNNRIELFQYGPCDSNRVPIVSDNFAVRDKLKMSGSEMLMFVRIFGILVGDKVPHSDPYWALYLKLLQLLDKCLDKKCSRKSISLKIIVREFNEMYVHVTGDKLKPKMHFLVHYSTVQEQSGPIALMSTKRFESKHRALLIPAHATESRRNICKTVAIQHQLQMCYRFKSNRSVLPRTEIGPVSLLDLRDFDHYATFRSLLPECLQESYLVMSPNWVNFKGSKFQPGMVVLLKISDSGFPVFGVVEIILSHENNIVFVYSCLFASNFDEHVNAYEVEFSDKWSCVNIQDLYDPLPLNIYYSVLGSKYIVLRHSL